MVKSGSKTKGVYLVEQVRGGKVINSQTVSNIITTEGCNHYLDSTVGDQAAIATWYAVAYESAVTPLATHDYAAPHGTELNAKVSDANRVAWVKNADASAGSISNSSAPTEYTIASSVTVNGVGLVGGSSTKADVTNNPLTHVLLSAVLLTTSLDLVLNDKLRITATFTMADDGV